MPVVTVVSRASGRFKCRSRLRLATEARLQFDPRSGVYLLVCAERGLVLNDAAAAIVELCDGSRSVVGIAKRVAKRFNAAPSFALVSEVRDCLRDLARRGLLDVVEIA